jgi:phosphoribosylglycinamide formyltransferase-1
LAEVRQYSIDAGGNMTARGTSKRASARLEKLVKLSKGLPEIEVSGRERLHAKGRGAGHLKFFVGKKTVAYYLNDHHGDGVLSLCCKTTPLEQADLVEVDPEQFYIPKYIGSKGWVGVRLDLRRVDWEVVKQLLWESYRLQAPKRLARKLERA